VHQGRRYPHTIDGSTGRPVDNGLASVSVLHPLGLRADAYATALTVMGPDEGRAFADERAIAARFLVRGRGALIETTTAAWRSLLQ